MTINLITMSRTSYVLLIFLLTAAGCSTGELSEITPSTVGDEELFEAGPYQPLKDASPFPVGNVWSAGQPTWGDAKGTDLGGPSDDFSPNAFGGLSTIVQKDLDLASEYSILTREFNSITPEVALKPHNISITPDSIDFSEADAMMAFAEANGLRVHGHVLLFEKSVPEWALEYEENGTWTEAQWEAWLENYITTVVGRYRGRIAAWDVLNEIGLVFGGGLNTDYFWWRVIGDDFIKKAFLWAEAADPDAKFFINDFAIGLFHDKLRDILDVADELRAQGCKVDGIGFQGHVILPMVQGDYWLYRTGFEMAANAGYLVHLSELDVGVNILGLTQQQSDLQHRIQRKRYNDIARAYRDGIPQDQQWGITLWNIADRNSFLNTLQLWYDIRIFGGPDYPLLWDFDYAPKPAYCGFRNGLRGIEENWIFPPLWSTWRSEAGTAAEAYKRPSPSVKLRESDEWVFYREETLRYLIEKFGVDESEARRLLENSWQ